jgi:hypothetical protein
MSLKAGIWVQKDYIGETKQKDSRFKNGHLSTQLLNEKEYDNYYKFIFMTQIFIEYKHAVGGTTDTYTLPLEWLEKLELPFNWVSQTTNGIVDQIIYFLEKYLIFNLRPELNKKDNRLGHTDINTTMNIYAHMTVNMEEKASQQFSKLMKDLH